MDAVDEIKRRVDIGEYVGRSVDLKRSGRNLRGLCPFHAEKTPSFYVFPDRGTWRCFGQCGEGGDLFSYAQKHLGLEFRDTLIELAREAGVPLQPVNPERRSRHERLAAVLEGAIRFYQEQLAGPDGADARAYLHERRGLSEETVGRFGLGWAPTEWRELREHLSARGFSDQDLLDAGLTVTSESGGEPYDRFRSRVTFPIYDERGAPVGIGGRTLGDEQPKYLNSPQTELFDKGRTLYGLNWAAEEAREAGEVVVVEGYMDVIGPHQAGFKNVVATMGTSLTEAHARLLRRYATKVVLAMDPDGAGSAAAERAGAIVLGIRSAGDAADSARAADAVAGGAQIDLRVARLPAGMDPDDVAREAPEKWSKAIGDSVPFPEFLIDRLIGGQRPESGVEARRLVDQVRPVLISVRDPVERAMYVQRLARRLGVNEQAVAERIRPGPRAPARPQQVERRVTTQEDYLLAIILAYPALRYSVRNLPVDLFADSLNREIFTRWNASELDELEIGDESLNAQLSRLKAIRLPAFSSESARKAAREKIDAILKERLAQRQGALVVELAAAELAEGPNRIAELGASAWLGNQPLPADEELAHLVIEELELGLSLHRHEAPELA